MARTIEIRWHGRGGQGAKTGALLLATAAYMTGRHVQGFPEYGPERMGAPITAYTRISDTEIRNHANIYEPDYVVVVDESLLEKIDVAAGIKPGGAILVNSARSVEEVTADIRGYDGDVYVIDANGISRETMGKVFPNIPLLTAIVRLLDIMDDQFYIDEMEKSLQHKFASKPEVVAGNLKAIYRTLEEMNNYEH